MTQLYLTPPPFIIGALLAAYAILPLLLCLQARSKLSFHQYEDRPLHFYPPRFTLFYGLNFKAKIHLLCKQKFDHQHLHWTRICRQLIASRDDIHLNESW